MKTEEEIKEELNRCKEYKKRRVAEAGGDACSHSVRNLELYIDALNWVLDQ